ncbi:hypothetical protein BJ508DRAFT_374276 [Ascobolus immersus RN42]|uniref:Uncharacterized protein n=1 Tax=Ascobolus immersus RN42 TaxID=1160509 RepID=A0A3N4IET2_ASCIM|nr:hypothetical protein BJ508DRAFT_374276 [Ascobolus immersus RN42]
MKFLLNTASILALALHLTTAIAVPVSTNELDIATPSGLEKRQLADYPKAFEVCKEAKYKGKCERFVFEGSQYRCYNFGERSGWRYAIKSIRPNKGFECRVYTGPLCTGGFRNLDGDEGSDLSKIAKGKFNANIFALRCWKIGDAPELWESPNSNIDYN